MKVTGQVIHGDREAGDHYGVPTANLLLETGPQWQTGIFAGRLSLNGAQWGAAICLRKIPTGFLCEVHVLGFTGDLYGQEIEVEILDRVSDLTPFKGEEQMRQKIRTDLEKVKYVLGNHST